MDKIRIALIAVIIMISFMLVTEYASFRDDKNKARLQEKQTQASLTLNQTPAEINTGLNDAEELAEQSTSNASVNLTDDEDIPSLSAETDTVVEVANTVRNQELIFVKTDTFSLHIDPRGGDIVDLALNQHLTDIDMPNLPFALLENNQTRTYIAQSGLIGKNGTDTREGRPLFASSAKSYRMGDEQEQLEVNLVLEQQGVEIIKRFRFSRDSYLIELDYLINNNSENPFSAAFYGQIKRDNSQDPGAESGGGLGMQPYLGFATTTSDERFKKIDFEDVAEKTFQQTMQGGWIAMIQHYYLSAWVGDANSENRYNTVKTRSGFNIARVTGPVINVDAKQNAVISNQFYAGPKDQYTLEKIAPNLDLSVDYGWLWFIAQPLYALLFFINNGVFHAFGFDKEVFSGIGNWGFSIIILTILVKLAFFSLNAKAYRSMAKMRAVQPKMLELREKYGDDRQKQSQEMMKLYQTEGVNPIGGCLPMLVQMPVFIALYWVLLESVELRHAPFIGYIKDLAAMDPYFIMPLVMGASMWFQQKLNPPPPDPMQAKVMQFLPIIFTFFFLFFPAGLVLYWVVNNILSIAQQWIITKHILDEKK